jgi:hypothetical protein
MFFLGTLLLTLNNSFLSSFLAIMNMTLLCAQEIVEHKDFAAVTTLLMFFRLSKYIA